MRSVRCDPLASRRPAAGGALSAECRWHVGPVHGWLASRHESSAMPRPSAEWPDCVTRREAPSPQTQATAPRSQYQGQPPGSNRALPGIGRSTNVITLDSGCFQTCACVGQGSLRIFHSANCGLARRRQDSHNSSHGSEFRHASLHIVKLLRLAAISASVTCISACTPWIAFSNSSCKFCRISRLGHLSRSHGRGRGPIHLPQQVRHSQLCVDKSIFQPTHAGLDSNSRFGVAMIASGFAARRHKLQLFFLVVRLDFTFRRSFLICVKAVRRLLSPVPF